MTFHFIQIKKQKHTYYMRVYAAHMHIEHTYSFRAFYLDVSLSFSCLWQFDICYVDGLWKQKKNMDKGTSLTSSEKKQQQQQNRVVHKT